MKQGVKKIWIIITTLLLIAVVFFALAQADVRFTGIRADSVFSVSLILEAECSKAMTKVIRNEERTEFMSFDLERIFSDPRVSQNSMRFD